MPGLLALMDAIFSPVFEDLQPGSSAGARLSQRADVQLDGALPLARSLGLPPRQVAQEIVAKARQRGADDACQDIEVAGPGFVNITLRNSYLAQRLRLMSADPVGLGVGRCAEPLKVVVDYGGPNAAKEMHVGHLRSAIIGDCLVRMLEFVGHQVVRENHVGDWGTPFGMLVEHLLDMGEGRAVQELAVGDLEGFYKQARTAYDTNPAFAERARGRVVLLQSGDPETLRLWRVLVDQSTAYFDQVFRSLGIKLRRDDVVGESFYNPMLPSVVSDLGRAGLLVESDGAMCVFPPGHSNKEGQPLPLIVQKSDGGYTYATTDLAALRDRVVRQGAQVVLYVVGLPQAQHFEMVFAVARQAGWLPDDVDAVHVGFGNVLGPDGKMFRTRQGGSVKLAALLEEAVQRARAVVIGRGDAEGQIADADLEQIARSVGVGAVKYADLSTDRVRDYRFDWDRMLAFDGNTGPYLQYAHTRIMGISRRAAEAGLAWPGRGSAPAPLDLASVPRVPEERELAKCILGFEDAVAASISSYSPHKMCNYLFELASIFTTFYEKCPVLRSEDVEVRRGRLDLCYLSGKVLEKGLGLLGIDAPEHM